MTMVSSFRCVICGSHQSQSLVVQLSNGSETSIYICSQCGMAQRRHAHTLGQVHDIQLKAGNGRAREVNRRELHLPRRINLMARRIKRMVAPGSSVLDVGCGNGTWLTALGAQYTKYGIELSEACANVASKSSGASIFIGPYEEYPEKRQFDLITAFAVIEHLYDPISFVKWANAHLLPGGFLVLMTGDRESGVASRMGAKWPLYKSVDHLSYFSARAMWKLLENNGFNVVREEWRFYAYPHYSRLGLVRPTMKLLEILGLTSIAYNDHYYCYANKVSIGNST